MDEVKSLSGAKTKKEAVEKALEEFIRRRKARKLIELELNLKGKSNFPLHLMN